MNPTPEPPSNIIGIRPECTAELDVLLKKQEAKFKCHSQHKRIEIDPVTRTIQCLACGFSVDPFDYILDRATEGARIMQGIEALKIERRVSEAELADLKRKCDNLRATLKRTGQPQPQVERQFWNDERLNAPYRVVK